MAQRLDKEAWKNVWRNVKETMEEEKAEGNPDYMFFDIEVTWLDGSDEWVLNVDCELLEDGFKSEEEAQERLNFVQKNFF